MKSALRVEEVGGSVAVTRVCHDFRNINHAIAACAELLRQARPEEREALIECILEAVRTSEEMTTDTLDRAREAALGRRYVPAWKEFDLSARLRSVVALFEQRAKSAGITLVTVVDNSVPVVLAAAPLAVAQIMSNFLTNGIKYAPRGSTITITAELASATTIRLAVSDQGAGIPAELRARLFMPFSQAVDAKPGSGIGLCHCRELVEELGGTIGVDSVCGSGSKFFVTLPFQAVEASGVVIEMRKSAAQQPAEKAARSMSVHVLIVDDNLGLAALTVLMLAQAGMTSECIDNVETALALLEESNFTLLLVDEGLLGGSGIDLVAQVRSAGNSIPVIGMSGSGLGDEFRKAGANEFIAKPFRKEALLKLIDEVLESAELAAAGAI